MRKEEFCEVFGGINENYVKEARTASKSKKTLWVKWTAAAACLTAVIAGAATGLTNLDRQPGDTPPASSAFENSGRPQGTESPAAVILSMEDIAVNEISGFVDAARKWYDPALYDSVVWDEEDILGYYGKDLVPAYIPDGLTASPQNGSASVIIGKDGSVALDTVWLNFYHDYYEDGSPKLTEEVSALKGFVLTASKIGLMNDCVYLLPEDEVKVSDIGGTPVTFGYRRAPYGPYDPETHEPSGYFDMYVAEFEFEDIQYQILAEQMELEEVVKVAASIISGEESILINE